jgi:hypothetical protein
MIVHETRLGDRVLQPPARVMKRCYPIGRRLAASRVMGGSDRTVRPDALRIVINAIQTAPFPPRKRDILHDNAARFLGLPMPGRPSRWSEMLTGSPGPAPSRRIALGAIAPSVLHVWFASTPPGKAFRMQLPLTRGGC